MVWRCCRHVYEAGARPELGRSRLVLRRRCTRNLGRLRAGRLRGGGDATRNAILGESYGKDPEFFEFFRSLEAYKETFAQEGTTMVLSPDSDFFKYFGDLQGGRDRVTDRQSR